MSESDDKLKKMERKLKKIYKQSTEDVTKNWKTYMDAQNAYVKDLQEAYQLAKQYGTDAEAREIGKRLGAAKAERTLQNQYYKDMVAETTRKLAEVNITALAYVNNEMPWFYKTNYNEAAKMVGDIPYRFDLVDESTVRRMATDGDIKLPKKKVNIPKDQRWNTKKLNSAVLQGIVNGESIDKIADRIMPIVGENYNAAVRNARTMATGAENLGRQDSYERMENDGVLLKKIWMATHDERTRESHAEMDGEEVNVNDKFSNGLMYPGDPSGDPGEVYNCRCTMVTRVYGFVNPETGAVTLVDVDHYDPDYFQKREVQPPAPPEPEVIQPPEPVDVLGRTAEGYTAEQAAELERLVEEADGQSGEVYKLFSGDLEPVVQDAGKNEAYYSHADKRVHFRAKESVTGNSLQAPNETHFHEYGHNIDYMAGGPGGAISKQFYYEGKTFEETITGELEGIIRERVEDSVGRRIYEDFHQRVDIDGTANGSGFVEGLIRKVARATGAKRNDPTIVFLREEAAKLTTDIDRIQFIEDHKGIFAITRTAAERESDKKKAITGFCNSLKKKHSLRVRGNLSDIMEPYCVMNGAGAYPLGAGHGKSYALSGRNATETFAEMIAAEISNKESMRLIEEHLPKSVGFFHKLCEKVIETKKGGK